MKKVLAKIVFGAALLTLWIGCSGGDGKAGNKVGGGEAGGSAAADKAEAPPAPELAGQGASSEPVQTDDGRYLIGPDGVGPFVLGGEIPTDVEGYQIKKETRYGEEGAEYEVYVVLEGGAAVLEFNADGDDLKIRSIKILSDKYYTGKGIKIGSDIEALAKAHPASEVSYTYYPYGGDDFERSGYFIDISEVIRMRFELENKNYVGKQDLNNVGMAQTVELSLQDFKPGTKVAGIKIYKY